MFKWIKKDIKEIRVLNQREINLTLVRWHAAMMNVLSLKDWWANWAAPEWLHGEYYWPRWENIPTYASNENYTAKWLTAYRANFIPVESIRKNSRNRYSLLHYGSISCPRGNRLTRGRSMVGILRRYFWSSVHSHYCIYPTSKNNGRSNCNSRS